MYTMFSNKIVGMVKICRKKKLEASLSLPFLGGATKTFKSLTFTET